ncbi:MAG: YraN family protein [Candidatus Caldatribacteriota bacterium]|nr:YraN family protein [Candidatus Caldatribacteriota bacterium]
MGNINIGKYGEDLACDYLETKGYKIKERNFRTYLGELDIICEYKGNIIFVEVKTRRSDKFGYPEEAINLNKQQKIIKNALCYLAKYNLWKTNCYFDVVLVSISNHEDVERIKHIRDAFYLDGRQSF